jgi:hypothetical protein
LRQPALARRGRKAAEPCDTGVELEGEDVLHEREVGSYWENGPWIG